MSCDHLGPALEDIERSRSAWRRAEEGQRWLRENRHRIELHRLPAYSPEFMAMEGVWKTTRKLTTHNAFFVTPDQVRLRFENSELGFGPKEWPASGDFVLARTAADGGCWT
jgi:hypothetical protein